MADFAHCANAEGCVLIQVETAAAGARVADIAAVDGVDAIFAGPGDLSAACGHIGDIGHAEVQAHLRGIAEACRRIGTPCGTVGPNPDMVKRFVDYGYSFVAVASDMGMMMRQAREYLAEMQRAFATGAAGGS